METFPFICGLRNTSMSIIRCLKIFSDDRYNGYCFVSSTIMYVYQHCFEYFLRGIIFRYALLCFLSFGVVSFRLCNMKMVRTVNFISIYKKPHWLLDL